MALKRSVPCWARKVSDPVLFISPDRGFPIAADSCRQYQPDGHTRSFILRSRPR